MSVLLSALTSQAQDIITLRNGNDIKAKVLEIDNSNVKYKLFDEPDGVTYTMRKSEILIIRYQSGRNEIFNTSTSATQASPVADNPDIEIVPGMKYKELKQVYNYKEYTPRTSDEYNPAVMGLCSWLVPGLGQMISDEVGRGFGWFGGYMACAAVSGVGAALAYDAPVLASIMMLAGATGALAVDICSIVDACRVAKVKNMYNSDLRQMNYSLELRPSVDYVNLAGRMQPTCGVTLALKF